MKNLLFAVLALITISLNAQITISSKVLTPAEVNTTSTNPNLSKNDKWNRAKAQVKAGKITNLDSGLNLVTLVKPFDVTFEKNHSRQGASDVKFVAYSGQQFLQDPITAETRYLPCLNVCSTFEPTQVIPVHVTKVDTVRVGGSTYTTINHNYYSNTDGSTTTTNPDLHQGEAVFIGNNNQFTSPSSCYAPEAEWNIIEDNYDDKKIKRGEAKQIFIELQLMYPYCLGNKDFSKVWRNDGEHLISGGVGFVIGLVAEKYLFNARQRFQSQNPNSPYRYNDSSFEKWGRNAQGRNGLISNRRNKVASNNFRKLSSNIRNVKDSSGNIRSSVNTRNSGNYSRGTRKTRSTASSLRTNTTTRGTRTQSRFRSNGSSSSISKGTTRASSSYSSRFGRGQRQRGNY
jgi:hypothetical protein